MRKQACTGKKKQAVCGITDNILQRSSNYFKSKNTLARVLQVLTVKEQTFSELQNKAELTIFSAYQKQVDNYIQNFRGSGFYTWKDDKVTYIRKKHIYWGNKVLIMPPKNSIVYKNLSNLS